MGNCNWFIGDLMLHFPDVFHNEQSAMGNCNWLGDLSLHFPDDFCNEQSAMGNQWGIATGLLELHKQDTFGSCKHAIGQYHGCSPTGYLQTTERGRKCSQQLVFIRNTRC